MRISDWSSDVCSSDLAIADTLAVTNTTGTLTLTSSDETIGSISGTGNVNLNDNTLTTGGDGTSTTLSGVISGTGALTKQDRKSVVKGKSVSVSVDRGGRRIIKKKNTSKGVAII